MTTSVAVKPGSNGTKTEFESICESLQLLRARFELQQDSMAKQQGEIERLNAKIEQLRDMLDEFYKHHGMDAKPFTPEEIKDMDENGVSLEEFIAEMEKNFGV